MPSGDYTRTAVAVSGTIGGHLNSNLLDFWQFVRIILTDGTEYFYTNKPAAPGTDTWVFGFEGITAETDASETWTIRDLEVGPVAQNMNDSAAVTWVKLSNLDYTFTNIVQSVGLREARVTIYDAYFDPADTSVLVLYMLRFDGRADDHEVASYINIVLKPHATPWGVLIPSNIIGPTCINNFKDPDTCKYTHPGGTTGSTMICNKTRAACNAMDGGSNILNFNGFDLIPPANVEIPWVFRVYPK